MDHNEWVKYGVQQLSEARTASRLDLYKTIDQFRGISAYDHHAWYKASKSIISALFSISELAPGIAAPGVEETHSPGDFADRLAAYRSFLDSLVKDLDGHAADYMQEYDVKAPPPLLETVRDRAVAIRATIQDVIGKAPSGIFRRP